MFEETAPLELDQPWVPGRYQLRALRLHYLPGLPGPELDPDDAAALHALR